MAKVEKKSLPDSAGLGSTEVTEVTHEVYPLKPNENKTKEYKSNEELQRDRFRAFEAAKVDAWIPDRSASPEEVVTKYKKVISDNSESYVNRFRTPKKSVKLFVALRLVRKSAKYRGAMKLTDLEIIASKALEKYDELVTAASGTPIESFTKHPDIKSFIETELDSYNNGGKKEPTIASGGPAVLGGGPTPVAPGPAASPAPGVATRPIPAGVPRAHAFSHSGSTGERSAIPEAAAATIPSPAAPAPAETVTEEEINNATAPDPADLAEIPPTTVPRVEPPTGKYAAYNTEVHLTEKPDKTYFVKADDYNTYEFGMEVTGYDPKKKKLTKLKKLQLHEVYTHRVDDSNRGTGYFIKPSDLANYNGSAHVYGWDGTRSEPELIYITDHL